MVRVLGTACGLGVQGSGWIAGDGVIVTNAHVVAGQEDTTVQLEGVGAAPRRRRDLVRRRRTTSRCCAASGVSGTPALAMNVSAAPGTSAAILGFPENGAVRRRARDGSGATVTATTQDAYGRGPIRRRITTLRGLVRHGNSGGPMVDGRGRVVATIFASAERGGAQARATACPTASCATRSAKAQDPVDTGPCVR